MTKIDEMKDNLINIFHSAKIPKLTIQEQEYIKIIIDNAYKNKAVWTVLITLLYYKVLNPKQDIRYHKVELKNGFSGRTFDTKIVTPTLKKLNTPSMAESGWLTRSLEQAYPYTLDYKGKISNKNLKNAFLHILNIIETFNSKDSAKSKAADFLNALFAGIKDEMKKNQISITPLAVKDNLDILNIISLLDLHFHSNYRSFGASKLPVIAFYAIYQILIKELKRYENCNLKTLGSHTASDKTSKSAGDIEIIKDSHIYEAIEIKLDKEIDSNMINIAYDKICKFSPKRYSIFSTVGIKISDKDNIDKQIKKIREEHGCQIILNGVLASIKYYLRLIENLDEFIENYSKLVEIDNELKMEHKIKLNELLKNINTLI